jgi:hypothetical protein
MATEDGTGRASSDHRLQLLQEMRGQNFDMIRFASYRTACKLRFVQKKANRKLKHTTFEMLLNMYLLQEAVLFLAFSPPLSHFHPIPSLKVCDSQTVLLLNFFKANFKF